MCGIFAALGWTTFPQECINRALDQMAPRGPDDQGHWTAPGACLGHRRLAILDLDHRAAQPMPDATGRYVISFNGEIYNFRDLRRQLEHTGVDFRTTSDTEVILALFAAEGEAMLPKLHGMFAFVIWDRLTRPPRSGSNTSTSSTSMPTWMTMNASFTPNCTRKRWPP